MNEYNKGNSIFIICIIIIIICSVLLPRFPRITGFDFIQGRTDDTYRTGNGTEQFTEQLIDSQRRIIELEQRIDRIKESSDRAAKGLERGIEESRGIIDKIEQLRIIFKVLEECYSDVRHINSLSDGGYYNDTIN
jgi:hypothetical protein